MEDNTENFISSVRSLTPLWDMKDKRYHSRDIQRKLWAKVAQDVGGEVAELKKKWKNLRDIFRREFKKSMTSGQEAPEEFESTWPFFNQMLFLRDVMEPRQLKGNISPPASELPSDDRQEENSELEGDIDAALIDTPKSNTSAHQSEPHRPTSTPVKKNMGPPATTPSKGKFKRLQFEKKSNEPEFSVKNSSHKKKKPSLVDSSEERFLEIEKSKLKFRTRQVFKTHDEHKQAHVHINIVLLIHLCL